MNVKTNCADLKKTSTLFKNENGTNNANESIRVTAGFNNPSGWAFTKRAGTMWWPELYGNKESREQRV